MDISIPGINNFIDNIVNQYVVRPTGMPGQTGIAGFLFDVLDEEFVSVDSDITDHFVENNYAIQDHIALRPVKFSVRGFIGELADTPPSFDQSVMNVVQQITTVSAYATQFTAQAQSVYDLITANTFNVSAVIDQAASVYNLFGQLSTTANKQQNAYNYFFTLWSSRILCSVETPYRIFTNMAIESIRARQDGTTRYISDFIITFKQIRTVNTIKYGEIIPDQGTLLSQSGRVDNLMADYIHGSQTSGDPSIDIGLLRTAFQANQQSILNAGLS